MERAATNLDELYNAHSLHLNRFMYRLTGNREEANDLVQDIFLKLCQQVSLPEHPKEWLSLTGYRLFVDRWRRKRRVSWLPLDDQALPGLMSPEQTVIDREFERQVRMLLLRFTLQMRTAMYLRIYRLESYSEIARRLNCPENTVKSMIRRGKIKLSMWLASST